MLQAEGGGSLALVSSTATAPGLHGGLASCWEAPGRCRLAPFFAASEMGKWEMPGSGLFRHGPKDGVGGGEVEGCSFPSPGKWESENAGATFMRTPTRRPRARLGAAGRGSLPRTSKVGPGGGAGTAVVLQPGAKTRVVE